MVKEKEMTIKIDKKIIDLIITGIIITETYYTITYSPLIAIPLAITSYWYGKNGERILKSK